MHSARYVLNLALRIPRRYADSNQRDESLQRTKELTLKDLWIEQQGQQRGKYSFVTKDTKGRETGLIEMRVTPDAAKDDDDD